MTLPAMLKDKNPTRDKPIKSDAHRKWVRQHECCVPGCKRRPIQAAHVRNGLPPGEKGGLQSKPGDQWCISLCAWDGIEEGHHEEQHKMGEGPFAKKYRIDLVALAREFAARSPHRNKLRPKQ